MNADLEEMLCGGSSAGSQVEGFSTAPGPPMGEIERFYPATHRFHAGSIRPGDRGLLQVPASFSNSEFGSGRGAGSGSASAPPASSTVPTPKIVPIIPPVNGNGHGIPSSSSTAFFRIAPTGGAASLAITTAAEPECVGKKYVRLQQKRHALPRGVTAVFSHDRRAVGSVRAPTNKKPIYKATFGTGERFPPGPNFRPIRTAHGDTKNQQQQEQQQGQQHSMDVFDIDNLSVDGDDEREVKVKKYREKGAKGKGKGKGKDRGKDRVTGSGVRGRGKSINSPFEIRSPISTTRKNGWTGAPSYTRIQLLIHT